MTSATRWLLLSCAVALGATAGLSLAMPEQEGFPHEQHERLFPTCLGCHEGIPAGNRAASHPDPALCTRCHDGVAQRRVTWTGPLTRTGNLIYSHPVHDAKEGVDCSVCHTPAGAGRMVIRRTVVPQCLSCHAHRATDHYGDATCSTCHVPLAISALSAARMRAIPRPADHERPAFLETLHGQQVGPEASRCSTCHTRELCAACHVNAATLSAASAIPAGQLTVGQPEFKPRYFEPASHLDRAWLSRHGAAAGDPARCSTCHTRESCLTCHRTQVPRPVNALPRAVSVRAPGVTTALAAPASHATPFFEREHGALGAAALSSCTSCHARSFCEDCHGARQTRTTVATAPAAVRSKAASFHLPNFAARHASAAYNRNLECESCHNTTVFCRSCHQQAGLRSAGRLGPGFHDAEPLWLLRHGQAARQGLESCASCHEQRNCTQCHAQTGAFQVNPHGRNFDAAAAHARNPRVCLVCHLTDPIRRR